MATARNHGAELSVEELVELFNRGEAQTLMRRAVEHWLRRCKPHSDFATVMSDEGDNTPMGQIMIPRPAAGAAVA